VFLFVQPGAQLVAALVVLAERLPKAAWNSATRSATSRCGGLIWAMILGCGAYAPDYHAFAVILMVADPQLR
jgi:hypothetical protein